MSDHTTVESDAWDFMVARDQLGRMRGMTALYHRQFFADVRFTLVIMITLLGLGFWGIDELFLVVPFVALWGACQTAFDASYLIFARQYASALERWINSRIDQPVLVASAIEDVYLFPLHARKVVTVPLSGPITWFGFMTLFTTMGGLVAAVAALWLGSDRLSGMVLATRLSYLGTLGGLAIAALGLGLWWFVGGVGERRVRDVLAPVFGRP